MRVHRSTLKPRKAVGPGGAVSGGGVGLGEADQGLTHHSKDPSGGHAPGPESCPAMSRMAACQGDSLAAGGIESQVIWNCPPQSPPEGKGYCLHWGLDPVAQDAGVTLVKLDQDSSASSVPEFCPVDTQTVQMMEGGRARETKVGKG